MDETQGAATRILLVDDDPVVLGALANGLAKLGYRVDTADSGAAALAHYRRSPPDLVVLDYRMPGMTGVEAARAMLQETARPVLMLSASSEVALVREAIGLGVSGYLVKPVSATQLAPSIEAALSRFAEVNALIRQGTDLQACAEKNRLISTATGIVMERLRLPDDVAFQHLRKTSRDQRRPLREVAFELVDATSTVNRLLGGRGRQ